MEAALYLTDEDSSETDEDVTTGRWEQENDGLSILKVGQLSALGKDFLRRPR